MTVLNWFTAFTLYLNRPLIQILTPLLGITIGYFIARRSSTKGETR